MRSAELHGFLGLHLRTAYGIWGWTLYPLLTQAHNYSPTQKPAVQSSAEHVHTQGQGDLCIKENWLRSPSTIWPSVSGKEWLWSAAFVNITFTLSARAGAEVSKIWAPLLSFLRSLGTTPRCRENVLKALNKLTGGEKNMVKSYQPTTTADWASVGLLLVLPNLWLLVVLAAIPFKSMKFQSMFWWQCRHSWWVTALLAGRESSPPPSPETAARPSANSVLSVAEATASYSCMKMVSIWVMNKWKKDRQEGDDRAGPSCSRALRSLETATRHDHRIIE